MLVPVLPPTYTTPYPTVVPNPYYTFALGPSPLAIRRLLHTAHPILRVCTTQFIRGPMIHVPQAHTPLFRTHTPLQLLLLLQTHLFNPTDGF